MTLNEWASAKKRSIFDALSKGSPPSDGEYDPAIFRDALTKGKPQMSSTHFEPAHATFEFTFPSAAGSTLLAVRVIAPERIVFMPVPPWVVESVWQGEVLGSPQFESDADSMLEAYRERLSAGINDAEFENRRPVGKN